MSRDLTEDFYTYTQWCTFSDHSAVCLNRQKLVRGLTQWRMPDDVLEHNDFDQVIHEATKDNGLIDPVLRWELTKASIKWSTQEFTKFCRKQSNHELTSLRKMLCSINAHIYKGDSLEQDRLKIQDKIKQLEVLQFEDKDAVLEKNLEWVLWEGTGHPAFLHLEDENNFNLDIKQLKDEAGNMVHRDDVLKVLKDFYSELYACRPELSHSDMQEFLCHIHNLPKVKQKIDFGPITEQEVLCVIAKLRQGKSPGSDGLMAAFYKKFDCLLTPFLVAAFNSALEQGSLAPSQRLAIIILLFKKGLEDDAANYCPISLMNVDYKILAYVLTVRPLVCFKEVYHPLQTAYIPGRFIGTNICKMQDVIDYSSKNK